MCGGRWSCLCAYTGSVFSIECGAGSGGPHDAAQEQLLVHS